MDVVDPGADLRGVTAGGEGIEQFHLRARRLDRDHVGIHRADRIDDVVELRIAHVGVDLRLGRSDRGGQAEARDRPVEIVVPVRAPQRQPFAQGGLVDLDDPRAGLLQVGHLVPDRQRDLAAGFGARLVVANERPLQDRDRAGQHSLHRPFGQALGMAPPVHRHRPGPCHVAVEDRRPHAARAVALDPSGAGEGEAREAFAEVLDHVVALELAVHQNVEAEAFLPADRPLGLGPQEGVVTRLVEGALAVLGAGLADRFGLGERADRRGRQRGKAQALALARQPPLHRQCAPGPVGRDLGDPRAHRGIVGQRGAAARGDGIGIGRQFVGDDVRAMFEPEAQQRQFLQLLHREGEPFGHLRVELGLERQVDRRVEQRAGRGKLDLAPRPCRRAEPVEQGRQVAFPHVAPVDRPGRDDEVFARAVEHRFELFGRAHQIEVKPVHRQRQGQFAVVRQPAEICRQHDPRAIGAAQRGIGGAQGRPRALVEIEDQRRLVDLDPLRAGRAQPRQQLAIERQDRGQQGERIEARLVRLRQQQPGHRAEQHRPGAVAERQCLGEFAQRLGGAEGEILVRPDLGDHEVIIGVEPLGHFLRRQVAALIGTGAARHCEIDRQRILRPERAIGRGDRAEHDAGVEHLVVEREIVAGDHVDPRVALARPVRGAQPARGVAQRALVDPAGPEGFQRLLELAARADAGKAEIGGRDRHESSPPAARVAPAVAGEIKSIGWSLGRAPRQEDPARLVIRPGGSVRPGGAIRRGRVLRVGKVARTGRGAMGEIVVVGIVRAPFASGDEGPVGGRAGGGAAHPGQGRRTLRVRRRNPRPENVIASQAGLLARGSSRRPRPSRPCTGQVQWLGGAAARRSQLRGQRRIPFVEECHRLPVLAPPRGTGRGRGTSTARTRADGHRHVKRNIKSSLCLDVGMS